MRLLVGDLNGQRGVFSVSGDKAKNLGVLPSGPANDLMSLITNGVPSDASFASLDSPEIAVADIVPALPIEAPGKIICLGLNYVDHIKEGGYDIPTYPALFMRSRTSIMASGSPLVLPRCSEQLDYEAEMMIIVGKGGKHISEDAALEHVFGYTVFNDGSIRDYQRKTHQWTPGKNFDATGGVGPIVVTPDELPIGGAGLRIQSRVGDEILQDASTSDMMWSTAKTIATLSEYTTLEPGDLIALGTPPGVGHARSPQRWLRSGEVIEIEIEGIGICANPVVREEDIEKVAAE